MTTSDINLPIHHSSWDLLNKGRLIPLSNSYEWKPLLYNRCSLNCKKKTGVLSGAGTRLGSKLQCLSRLWRVLISGFVRLTSSLLFCRWVAAKDVFNIDVCFLWKRFKEDNLAFSFWCWGSYWSWSFVLSRTRTRARVRVFVHVRCNLIFLFLCKPKLFVWNFELNHLKTSRCIFKFFVIFFFIYRYSNVF